MAERIRYRDGPQEETRESMEYTTAQIPDGSDTPFRGFPPQQEGVRPPRCTLWLPPQCQGQQGKSPPLRARSKSRSRGSKHSAKSRTRSAKDPEGS
ncbi:hypothetical protein Pcinc_003690 [Petrolisthes cinctipes]|uniref:Uncharacterized protein n=1 Tax=Petrolisthes cinctipes TaxID=88211 RepID=A0AAE1GIL1_PETCI|nr:hypothetical protein Pcinc_003690 [Petrolisthes cinctipes]